MRKEIANGSLFLKLKLALLVLVTVFLAVLFIHREDSEEKDILPTESIHLSRFSPSIITETEDELNERLLSSRIKPLFYKATIQGDNIYIFLDQKRWKELSLNEKADVLLEVAQVCRAVGDSVGIPIEPDRAKPEINFYSRDSNKELAYWNEQGAIILN